MNVSKIRGDCFTDVRLPDAEPEISVLMPVCNQKKYVGDAVSSILSQEGIIAEIIVSDDGSDDGTFEEALRVISGRIDKGGCAHGVVVRRGKRRLWRDHLPLLIEKSRCDLVCQAHGDDLSAPTRCRDLAAACRTDPLISMVTSEAFLFADPQGGNRQGVTNGNLPKLRVFSQSEILDGHDFLIGSLQAWRKSAVEGFPPLDSNYSATSHDRILAFRASLAGKVTLLQAPLVNRRMHPSQASNLLFHEPDGDGRFGRSLLRINALSAMRKDLWKAGEMGFIGRERVDALEKEIRERLEIAQKSLVESFRIYTNSGKRIAWMDDRAIHILNNSFIKIIEFRLPSFVKRALKHGKSALRFIRGLSTKSITGSKREKRF